jgi:hypothetical protein
MRLALLFNGASDLQLDATALFADFANLSRNPALSETIRGFPKRPPETRDLSAFLVEPIRRGREFSYRFRGF